MFKQANIRRTLFRKSHTMNIYIARYEEGRMGGGWSFMSNFAKAFKSDISDYSQSDIFFITSASMVERSEVEQAKNDGKKIVLRCDNIIRNSRNRNTGMTRMKSMAEIADLVVYQSQFARNLLDGYLLPKNSTVILNSTDTDTFYTSGERDYGKVLWARSSSDETKNWEMARSMFQQLTEPNKTLTIVGKPLDTKIEEYNFDFYMGEKVSYLGEIHDKNTMAEIYRNHGSLLFSFFNDACSNTLIEALCSGMNIIDCYGMLNTGGSKEIIDKFYDSVDGVSYFKLDRMKDEYKEAFEKL